MILQTLLNNAIPLAMLIPIVGWFIQFWHSNFKTNDVDHIDLVARWCYLQRRRAGKNIAYIEYPEYETPQEEPKETARQRLDAVKDRIAKRLAGRSDPKLMAIAKKAHDPEYLKKSLEHLIHE